MRFPVILAVSVVLLLLQCEFANCQADVLEEPTTKKPGFFSRLFGKGSTTTTTTTTTTAKPRSLPTNVPPTPARQPPNRAQQPNPFNPLAEPNLGPYPKPNQQPSGLSLSYGPTPPPRGVHSAGGSKTPLAPMVTPPASPTPSAIAPAMIPGAVQTSSTTTTTTTTAKPKSVMPQAPLARAESDFDLDPKNNVAPQPSSPTPTTTKKPTTVKEDFPALPAPRRPSIKEDFPALPSRPTSPVSPSSPTTPKSPSAWGSNPPPTGNRVSFVPHVPERTTVKPGMPTTEKPLATDDEIQQLTETLYTKETNSQINQITVNIQGKTRSIDSGDEAPQPLLQVDSKAYEPLTIAKMRDLFNNYELDTTTNEHVTPLERKEENDFLDAVMATNVMRQAMLFLQNKGIVSPDPKTHRDLVKTLWFTLYSRGQGKIGSSGFEHVFVNEVKNGTIIGLHNWVYFNEEEKAGRLDYKGYLNKLDLGNKGMIVKTRFTHNGLNKPVNTLFIGTSPELELALYTVCFELRTDRSCPVSLGGNKFNIQTYSWRYRGKNLIGSAYPDI